MKVFAKLSYAMSTTRVTGRWWPVGQQDAIYEKQIYPALRRQFRRARLDPGDGAECMG
jgi:hypothetical protein